MKLRPVARTSASDEVYDQLVGSIVGGDVSVGDAMPSERALADALGVSRPVVREALKRLDHAGLVRVRHGGATRVADYRRTAGPDLLGALLFDRKGELDLTVARGIVEARADLGPPVASAAARRAGPELLDVLDELVAGMHDTDDLALRQRLVLDFWDHLVDGADNVVYRLLFNALRRAYEPVMDALTVVLRAELSDVAGYAAVAAALRARDADAAGARVHAVVDHGTRAAIQVIDGLLAAPDPDTATAPPAMEEH